jgi:hypothetical protein
MVNVNLYLEEDDRKIASFEFPNGILQVGDIINVMVDEPHPKDLYKYPQRIQDDILEEYEETKKMFRLKEIIIKRKYISLDIRPLRDDKLTVDYYCEILN